jgi:hypothetical protein
MSNVEWWIVGEARYIAQYEKIRDLAELHQLDLKGFQVDAGDSDDGEENVVRKSFEF